MNKETIIYDSKNQAADYPCEIILAGKTADCGEKILRCPPPRHFLAGFVIDGKGFIDNGKVAEEVKSNEAFILGPGNRHTCYCDGNGSWEYIWIAFGGNLINSEIALFKLQSPCAVNSPRLRNIIELLHCYCRAATDALAVNSLAAPLLLELIQEFSKDAFFKNERKPMLAETVKNMLDGSVLSRNFVSDIAAQLNYSDIHINRIFKSTYGITPHKYIFIQKLRYSEWLLANTNMTVSEIAEQLGFSDEFHFSNSFFRFYGIRPRAFRKEMSGRKRIEKTE